MSVAESNRARTRSVIDRFHEKYQTVGACWLWTAARDPKGYGAFWPGAPATSIAKAHRWAYEYFIGPIPAGLFVCHRCDRPSCVNPEHLFLGTAQDNQSDMAAKGRSLRGELHNCVTLTEADVVEIRRLWDEGALTQTEIGARVGATKRTVSLIVRGKRWKHLLPDGWTPPPPRRWSRRR